MNGLPPSLAAGLAVALILPLLTWTVSLLKRDASIVDSLWSLMLLAIGIAYYAQDNLPGPRSVLVLVLLAAWAIRLSAFITWRNHGEPEDHRYAAMRKKHNPGFWWKSLGLVFLLQGLIAWIVSIPLWPAISAYSPMGVLDILALSLVLFGLLYESIADAQLAAFRSGAGNKNKVMRRGLWAYSRHPNYFGEACVWWGFYCFALAAGAWWTVFSPLLMTFLLLRVSGVSLLEKDIGERRPEYALYRQTTSAFIPWPKSAPNSPGAATE